MNISQGLRLIGALIIALTFSLTLYAETVYLKNGEQVKGNIKEVDDINIILESELGYGTLQIPRSEVITVHFPGAKVDMSRRYGLGYKQRKSTTNTSRNSFNYAADMLSFRNVLSKEFFLDFQFGYGSQTVNNAEISVFAADVRFANIFNRSANMMQYYGAGGGYIQVKDDTNNLDESGTSLEAFIGAELFFPSLPNFGFAGELAVGKRDTENTSSVDLSTSTFPSFSIHYYF